LELNKARVKTDVTLPRSNKKNNIQISRTENGPILFPRVGIAACAQSCHTQPLWKVWEEKRFSISPTTYMAFSICARDVIVLVNITNFSLSR
jgi:hypothetical protein